MIDTITQLGNSFLQHGRFSDRIYLMKLAREDFPGILDHLDNLALQQGYTKIFAKVPAFAKGKFIQRGYKIEAMVPRMYNGKEDVCFLGKYFTKEREYNAAKNETTKVLEAAKQKLSCLEPVQLAHGFTCKICDKSDIIEMAEVYQTVFETYPFPIQDPQYLAKTMNENVVYFGLGYKGKLVALSSSEMDLLGQNVEMTDFATLPAYRGQGFSTFLLRWMEAEMTRKEIKSAYTIARALSYGMNITFARGGYGYCGTLINNTNISGHLENMNVWYKCIG